MKTLIKYFGYHLIMLLSINIVKGQAVSWELSSQPGNVANINATFQSTDFVNGVLVMGPGIDAEILSGSMNASSWFDDEVANNLADAISSNNYYQFTIETENCRFFNPTTIKITLRSSADGPNTATLRCSSDGFTSDIGTVTVTNTSTVYTFVEIISPNSTVVTYRLYGYGDAVSGSPSINGTMQIGPSINASDNDIEVFATTTQINISSVSNIVVTDGDFVPSTIFTSNVQGATINWSRTPENIELAGSSGTGDLPSFTASNTTGTPVTCTFTVNGTVGTCTGPNMIFTITVNPPACTITALFLGSPDACNDNGTPNDGSDDFFTQNIQAAFFNRPLTGDLQIVTGGDAIGTYSIPVTQIIGNAYIFTDVKLKADGTPSIVEINFTDNTSCIDEATGPAVQLCSSTGHCSFSSIDLSNHSSCNNNGTIDPSDDYFEADVTVVFVNPPATGNLVLFNQDMVLGQLNVTVANLISNSHTFSNVKFKANGGATNVGAKFSDNSQCIISTGTTISVQPCSSNPPVVTCPPTLNVSCFEDVPAADPSSVSETHDCPGTVTIVHISDVESNVVCENQKTITRTYQLTDACGNSSNCTQTIIVNDNIPPTISTKQDIVLCGGSQIVNYTIPVGSDNCSAAVTQTAGLPPGSSFPAGTTINTFEATDACGNSVSTSFNVILKSIPAKPASISGPDGVCKYQTGIVFCVPVVNEADSYVWTLPAGISLQGTSTGACITVGITSSFCGGTIYVKAKNSCGTGLSTSLYVSLLSLPPSTPGSISGSSQLCTNTCAVYSIAKVSKATSYEWAVSSGLTIISGQGTNTVTVCASASFIDGTLYVKTRNCKGSSGSRSKVLSGITKTPVFCANSSGDNKTTGVCGGSTRSYAISSINNVNVFEWTAPTGATIYDRKGNFGNPLVVNGTEPGGKWEVDIKFPPGFISGNVTVTAMGVCGISAPATLTVKSVPSIPGSISGSSSVCKYSMRSYSISSVSGASSYTWTVNGGASIYSGQGTKTVYVKFNSASSNSIVLSVKANNSCGSSSTSTKNISVNLGCRTTEEDFDAVTDAMQTFSAFPNPASGETTISFNSETEERFYLRIYNLNGHLMFDENFNAVIGINNREIYLEDFAKGVYIVTLYNDGGKNRSLRIIKD